MNDGGGLNPDDPEDNAADWFQQCGVDADDGVAPLDLLPRAPHVARVDLVHRYRWPFAWTQEGPDGLDVVTLHDGHGLGAIEWRAITEGLEGRFRRRGTRPTAAHHKRVIWASTAAVILPRYRTLKALSRLGLNVPALASLFNASQITTARRLGEIKGHPVAVYGRDIVARGGGAPMVLSLPQIARIIRVGDPHWSASPLTDPRDTWMVWPREW